MWTDSEVIAAFVFLAACAALANAIAPKPKGWNNNRPATQRDLADVLRGKTNRDRRADPLYAMLLVLALAALVAILL